MRNRENEYVTAARLLRGPLKHQEMAQITKGVQLSQYLVKRLYRSCFPVILYRNSIPVLCPFMGAHGRSGRHWVKSEGVRKDPQSTLCVVSFSPWKKGVSHPF